MACGDDGIKKVEINDLVINFRVYRLFRVIQTYVSSVGEVSSA